MQAVSVAILALAVRLLVPVPAGLAAQRVEGRVTRVVDGDTVWCEDAHGTKLRIRLVGIDAPEVGHLRNGGGSTPGQPYGEEARRALTARVLREAVTLEVYGRDRYHRILGVVYLGPTNVNLWLVESGLAWAYKGGRNDAPATVRERIEAAEHEARRARRGLWADGNPDPMLVAKVCAEAVLPQLKGSPVARA